MITKEEIVRRIIALDDTQEHRKTIKQTREFMTRFLTVFHDALMNGEEINLPTIGRFKHRIVKEHEGAHPKTQERMTIPAYRLLTFKALKPIRDKIRKP